MKRRNELQILVDAAERTVRRMYKSRHMPASYPGAMDGRAKLLAEIDYLIGLRCRLDRLVNMSIRRSAAHLVRRGPKC